MSNVKVDEDKFLSEGGSELAAMSTTDNLKVAQSFAKSAQPLIFRWCRWWRSDSRVGVGVRGRVTGAGVA